MKPPSPARHVPPMPRCRTLVALLFCCGVAIRVTPQTTSKPQFKATVDLVRIAVIVRDPHGKAVRNLDAADFSVTDDGKIQGIDFFLRVERDRKNRGPRSTPQGLSMVSWTLHPKVLAIESTELPGCHLGTSGPRPELHPRSNSVAVGTGSGLREPTQSGRYALDERRLRSAAATEKSTWKKIDGHIHGFPCQRAGRVFLVLSRFG